MRAVGTKDDSDSSSSNNDESVGEERGRGNSFRLDKEHAEALNGGGSM